VESPVEIAEVIEDAPAAPAPFEPADRPWDELILVCAKCCAKIGPAAQSDGHARLRTEMKQLVRAQASATRVRVTEVSCLGVCPSGRISVGVFQPDGRIHLETVAPEMTGDTVLTHLRDVGAIAPVIPK
jgi:predicted metal-binding protein